MATIHKAPVDDVGTTLAYIDSGSVPGDTYTTVVLVHGHSFNSQTFTRLLPLASSYNLRVIAINRRDYANSTPFSDSDLTLLFSSNGADHQQFLQARGLEIARFLAWVIDELKVPPAASQNNARSKGGLVLLGWSLGSITTLAFLRHLSSFPKWLVDKIEPYLTTFIIDDSGYTTLGHPHPKGMYHPFRDTEIPAHKRKEAFTAWISSYFSHPYYTSSATTQASRTLESLVLRAAVPELNSDLDSTRTKEGSAKLASYANIDPEAFAAAFDAHPERSESAFFGTVPAETLYDQLAGSLFFSSSHPSASPVSASSNDAEPSGQTERSILLPELRVLYIYGTQSPWTTQWSAWALEADIASHPKDKIRPTELVCVEGGNHFLHWDQPDAFLALLAEHSGFESRSDGC